MVEQSYLMFHWNKSSKVVFEAGLKYSGSTVLMLKLLTIVAHETIHVRKMDKSNYSKFIIICQFAKVSLANISFYTIYIALSFRKYNISFLQVLIYVYILLKLKCFCKRSYHIRTGTDIKGSHY